MFLDTKTVKKSILILAALLSVAITAGAQQNTEKEKTHAQFGVGLSGRVYPTMAVVSRMAGPGVDFDCFWNRVIGPIDFGVGVGASYMLSLPENGTNANVSGVDIQIPITLRYGYQFKNGGPRLMVFGEAVPFVGAMLQQKTSGSRVDLYTDQYKRFDMMVGGGLGIILGGKIRINVGGDVGLLNRRMSGLSIGRNYQGYIGVAYIF